MKCVKCKSENTGNSPTGFWCNNCGFQDPCPCWRGNHRECMDDMNKIRIQNGVELVNNCCCGKLRENKIPKN